MYPTVFFTAFGHESDGEDRDDSVDELEVPDVPSSAQRKVVVSSDNAKNITSAVNGSFMQHIRCFAHSLNLSVQAFVGAIDGQLASMRSVIKHFHKSPGADDTLKASNPRKLKLKLDVPTRWNSTLDMVERYLELHTAVYTSLSKLNMKDLLKRHNKLDLEMLEEFVAILKPFKDITMHVSSQTTVSASLMKPLLVKLLKVCKPQEGERTLLHQAKARLYHDLERRHTMNDTDLLDDCSFWDPRTKSLAHISERKRSQIHCRILAAVQTGPDGDCDNDEAVTSESEKQNPGLLGGLLDDFGDFSHDTQRSVDARSSKAKAAAV